MLAEMPSSEMTDWKTYYRIEPWGEWRADLRAGTITAPLIRLWSKSKPKPSEWIMDFMPKEPQDPDKMKWMLKGLAAALKGRGKKANDREKKKQERLARKAEIAEQRSRDKKRRRKQRTKEKR